MDKRNELIVCGWDEVFIVDLDLDGQKVWIWRAEGQDSLPEEMPLGE